MTPAYAAKLSLVTWKTDIGIQKIDGSFLVTYEIVLTSFSVQNKLEKIRFFEKTFLLADTSIEVVLGMFSFIFSNANIQFVKKKLE